MSDIVLYNVKTKDSNENVYSVVAAFHLWLRHTNMGHFGYYLATDHNMLHYAFLRS